MDFPRVNIIDPHKFWISFLTLKAIIKILPKFCCEYHRIHLSATEWNIFADSAEDFRRGSRNAYRIKSSTDYTAEAIEVNIYYIQVFQLAPIRADLRLVPYEYNIIYDY